jgi:hypothetical protein
MATHAKHADHDVEQNHQGRVKDPAHDGRLKQNKDKGVSLHTTDNRPDTEHGHQGRVKDPKNDGRLKHH